MESDSSSLPILALGISLVLLALASVLEACGTAIHKERIKHLASQNVAGAGHLHHLASIPMGLRGLTSLLRAITLTASLISAASVVIAFTEPHWLPVVGTSTLVLAAAGVIWVASVRLSNAKAETIALRAALPLRVLAVALFPILAAESAFANRVLGSNALHTNGSANGGASADIAYSLDSEGEPLDEHEVKMIRAIVKLDKTTAREVMVPRVDMIAADVNTTIAELADLMVTSGHSRIPVYIGDLDHVEGVGHARDILAQLGNHHENPEFTVSNIMRPTLYIPESKTLEELLSEFQHDRLQMAIVVDEYGGVSGLVTIEDLLEEIVGEIQDEFDTSEIEIEELETDDYLMDARVNIDDMNELLGLSIEASGFDTIGGLVFHRLGKIPSQGNVVEYDGLRLEVVSTHGRRVKRVRVTRTAGSDAKVG